jgi:hypothetical protein
MECWNEGMFQPFIRYFPSKGRSNTYKETVGIAAVAAEGSGAAKTR